MEDNSLVKPCDILSEVVPVISQAIAISSNANGFIDSSVVTKAFNVIASWPRLTWDKTLLNSRFLKWYESINPCQIIFIFFAKRFRELLLFFADEKQDTGV